MEEILGWFIKLWKLVVMTKQFSMWLKKPDKRPGNDLAKLFMYLRTSPSLDL